jgi:hypothetical protein
MSIRRGEVIEVFNDLSQITSDKLDQLLGLTPEADYLPPLSSPESVVKNMPRDSLRVRVIGDEFSIICYPFFPSHLRFPIKVGEEVWVFLEPFASSSQSLFDPEKGASRSSIRDVMMTARNPSMAPSGNMTLGFWMCRPTSQRQVEDLNYTAFGRAKFSSGFSMVKASDIQQSATRSGYSPTFPYYSESTDTPERVEKNDSLLQSRLSDFIESFDLEAVARFTKMPGDTVIAGSHDSRIVLGQARAGRPSPAGTDAGAVDIVAGTGKGSNAPNSVANSLGFSEVDKDPMLTGKQDVDSEGDPDLATDLSRVMVAENIEVDGSFSIAVDATGGTDTAEKSGPSVIAKSQHVRVVSTSDGSVRILVEGPTKSSIVIDASGNIQIDAGAAVNIRTPSVLMTSAAGSGATATDVLIETNLSFQTLLSASLTELKTALNIVGITPIPATDTLISQLNRKKFSSKITRSD